MFKVLLGAVIGGIVGWLIGFGLACIMEAREMDDE